MISTFLSKPLYQSFLIYFRSAMSHHSEPSVRYRPRILVKRVVAKPKADSVDFDSELKTLKDTMEKMQIRIDKIEKAKKDRDEEIEDVEYEYVYDFDNPFHAYYDRKPPGGGGGSFGGGRFGGGGGLGGASFHSVSIPFN